MSEVIANLDYTVVDRSGHEYYVNVAGEATGDAQWEAWLEFVPLDDTDPLLTDTETTQRTRSAVAHWATTLSETYLQGAFDRATLDEARRIARTASPVFDEVPLALAAVIDPFESIRLDDHFIAQSQSCLSQPGAAEHVSVHHVHRHGH